MGDGPDEFPDFEFENGDHENLASMIEWVYEDLSSTVSEHEERISDLEESEAYERGDVGGKRIA